MPGHQKPPTGFVFIEDYVDEDGNVIVPGIATRLGISPSTYRKWRMAGKGPITVPHGKRVMASEKAINAYFERLEREAGESSHEMRPPEAKTLAPAA
ncbi:hypothetical protein [Streptomyces sp. 5-6(2022)]|uniref:hypothetical protein n=1 Tax=Streptomyces sp. 5-6(2022) TaxID=2936510 RepID=UPI0023B8A7FB|nr:hypothetical protein [Streptomyces sp. 5-6(2022)]